MNGAARQIKDANESTVYTELARHQRSEVWFGRDTVSQLQEWADRFIVEFKLDIPEITLRLDALPCNRYGHFRHGHNGFGLKGEIAINSRYLNRDLWSILGTLLHELLHAWQEVHGTPGQRNHHNSEFRDKALEFGLIIDKKGVTGYATNSPFKDYIRRFGIDAPDSDTSPPVERIASKAKLRKWSCGCTNVRCAVVGFEAQCLKCGKVFQRLD